MLTCLLMLVLGSVPQAGAQEPYDVYERPGGEAGWWQRTINASPWLQKQLDQSFTFGRSVAVVVGIGEYNRIRNLASPAADADRVTRFLIDEAGFDEVYTLKDEQVTFAALNRLMTGTLPGRVTGNDRFFFYWSGHGGRGIDLNGRAYGFLPLKEGTEDGRGPKVQMDTVRQWLRDIRPRHALFVFDACYSGNVFERYSAAVVEEATLERLSRPAYEALSSSASNQESYGYTDGSGGVFTRAFLNAARGGADTNGDGFVTSSEIAIDIQQALDRFAASSGNIYDYTMSVTPGNVATSEGRFFFVVPTSITSPNDIQNYIDELLSHGKVQSREHRAFSRALQTKSASQFYQFATGFPSSLLAPLAERLALKMNSVVTSAPTLPGPVQGTGIGAVDSPGCAAANGALRAFDARPSCLAARLFLERHGDSECFEVDIVRAEEVRLCAGQGYAGHSATRPAALPAAPPQPTGCASLVAPEGTRCEADASGNPYFIRVAPARPPAAAVRNDAFGIPAKRWTSGTPGADLAVFREGPEFPEMVVIPAGSFTMGASLAEKEEFGVPKYTYEVQGVRHDAVIEQPFALSKTEVTVGEWKRFVESTNHVEDGPCWELSELGRSEGHPPRMVLNKNVDLNWTKTGFSQNQDHPVVCVSWEGVQAYIRWINNKIGDNLYRLPSEIEWEYAARAGTISPFYWGVDLNFQIQCNFANGHDLSSQSRVNSQKFANCNDGYVFTSPVGSFDGNDYSLLDMIGNVSELTSNCWKLNENLLLKYGKDTECERPSLRGGAWLSEPADLRSAKRSAPLIPRTNFVGFRLARTLTP